MTTPYGKNPCPGVMKVTILVDPSLVIIILYNVHRLSDLRLGVNNKIFKGMMHFHYMTYIATP